MVVGGGVFGLSTALELVERGYYVCILDKYQPPSPWSAANDFNKIIRCEYGNAMYAEMAVEALERWRNSPLFKKSYSECGRLLATPLQHRGRVRFEQRGIENIRELGEGRRYRYYEGGGGLGQDFACLAANSIPANQQVKFNPDCGLGRSAETTRDVYEYLSAHPRVRFVFGESGEAVGVKKYRDGKVGVVTASGYVHSASTVVLAMGANTGKVLDLQNQQSATGSFVTHIQLTQEEHRRYADMPVIFDAEIGYFFPPDPQTKMMKLCLTGRGIKRSVGDPFHGHRKTSLPRYHNEHPSDTFPKDGVPAIRRLLEKYVPELADHKLFGSKICWFADRDESHFLIDRVPGFSNLYVASGDSGHGYKFFPNIGKYVVQKIEGVLDEQMSKSWKWESRLGAEAVDPSKLNWRVSNSKTKDLEDIDFVVETEASKL